MDDTARPRRMECVGRMGCAGGTGCTGNVCRAGRAEGVFWTRGCILVLVVDSGPGFFLLLSRWK